MQTPPLDTSARLTVLLYLSTVTHTSDGHFPSQDIMTNLGIIFVPAMNVVVRQASTSAQRSMHARIDISIELYSQLIECAHFEEQNDISVFLLDLPVLLL